MTAAEEVERVERHLAWALEFLRELDRAEREGRCTLDVSTRVGLRALLAGGTMKS